jgi:hypothetical protein
MVTAYSQRLSPPYSGQVQIAESERARAITMDGENWEIHLLRAVNGFRRTGSISHEQLCKVVRNAGNDGVDERIHELAEFLVNARLPFPAADHFEYWLLDPADDSPLALIFSCKTAEQMADFPARTEWTALPAAVMPIAATEPEQARGDSPVNYRLERLVAERAGTRPRAAWFNRGDRAAGDFPAFLIREDWQNEEHGALCQRYIRRQSTRLLMLHDLDMADRRRLEIDARPYAAEVGRFFSLYPEVADENLMNALRVEARMKDSATTQASVHDRRDGVLYI